MLRRAEAGPVGIRARSWGWRYATRRAPALSNVDLDIEPGERVLLLGASGVGKSTLLKALAGVLGGADEGDEQGELTVGGASAGSRNGVAGLVLQDPDAQIVLGRVGDDVAFGCENLGVPADEIWMRVRRALRAVHLDVPLSRSTAALSGGQKQRLALAGVLAMAPGLLLLDEPTANLDPLGVEEVRRAVVDVLDDTRATLVVVEHRVSVWAEVVDRVVVLGVDGKIADGAPNRVFTENAEMLRAAGVWLPGDIPERARTAPPSVEQSELLLRASDLSVARGRRSAAVAADGVHASVRAGRVLAITGPNGAGKTTLALTLAGLLPPVAGTVRATAALSGNAGDNPARWRSRQLAERIGMVFQEPERQFVASNVRAELMVGPRAVGEDEAQAGARVDMLLDSLGLTRLADANPFTLSGGEKRRLSVATALATRPRVMILDEPTFGQDARTWREMVALLASLAGEGTGVVAVTHDVDFVAALADDRLQLDAPAVFAGEGVGG